MNTIKGTYHLLVAMLYAFSPDLPTNKHVLWLENYRRQGNNGSSIIFCALLVELLAVLSLAVSLGHLIG